MAEITRPKLEARRRLLDQGLPEEPVPVIEEPLWKIRLRLLWRSIKLTSSCLAKTPSA
jgi:hypothetical protein